MKDSVIDNKDYEAVIKFYQALNLDNLGQLNKLYNFQDTVILAEIFEQRSNHLQELFKFNPESVIRPVLSAVASTKIKVNV